MHTTAAKDTRTMGMGEKCKLVAIIFIRIYILVFIIRGHHTCKALTGHGGHKVHMHLAIRGQHVLRTLYMYTLQHVYINSYDTCIF